MLQAQYADRLVGRLLDALRARGLFDDAVIVVTADHGASFATGEPRRPANRANVGAIAPVPFFVKLPGQREGRVDDRAVRTIDVLPTIAKAAGVRLPWQADGMPADERAVDPAAPIDVSHAGEPALTDAARLGAGEAARRASAVEARLLRDGVYAIGPRPELIGRRVAAPARRARRVTVDGEVAGAARRSSRARSDGLSRTPSSPSRSTAASRRPRASTATAAARSTRRSCRRRRCATGERDRGPRGAAGRRAPAAGLSYGAESRVT